MEIPCKPVEGKKDLSFQVSSFSPFYCSNVLLHTSSLPTFSSDFDLNTASRRVVLHTAAVSVLERFAAHRTGAAAKLGTTAGGPLRQRSDGPRTLHRCIALIRGSLQF